MIKVKHLMEPGAGGSTVAERLVFRMNQLQPVGTGGTEGRWTSWDRELVEKVAGDFHFSRQLIESLEESHPTLLSDLFTGFAADASEDKWRAYHRVSATIRALAQAGHAVIVGRGSVFVTRGMPGGVHVRLVAHFEHRVAEIARRMQAPTGKAAAHVRRSDAARAAFYRFYWPEESLAPESFTITLNTSEVPSERAVECILPLPLPLPAATATAPAAQLRNVNDFHRTFERSHDVRLTITNATKHRSRRRFRRGLPRLAGRILTRAARSPGRRRRD